MDETTCPTCGAKCNVEMSHYIDWRSEVAEQEKYVSIQLDLTKLKERFKEYIYRTTRPERNLVSISFAVDDVLRAVNELLEQEER